MSHAGRKGPKLWDQLELLQKELAAYSPHLAQLPAIVLANKAETLHRPAGTLAALRKRTALPVSTVPLAGLPDRGSNSTNQWQ
jgi:GTPase involved in cell partitioning and DNA repair